MPDGSQNNTRRDEVANLLVAAVLGDATDTQVAQLNELLMCDGDLRHYAAQFLADDVVLRQQFQLYGRVGDLHNIVPCSTDPLATDTDAWSCIDEIESAIGYRSPKAAPWRTSRRFLAILFSVAASLLIVVSVSLHTSLYGPEEVGYLRMTQFSAQKVAVQSASARVICVGDVLTFEKGLATLDFACGAQVFLRGPAEFEIISPMRTVLRRGTLTARVEESAHGFRVDTPNSQVTDLGTEFGVSVAENGETDMVVFSGRVAWEYMNRPRTDILRETPATPVISQARLLTEGEAMRVSNSGELHRLATVKNSDYPLSDQSFPSYDWAPVVDSVSDNLRDSDTTMCYRVVHQGFAEDARAFVDRPYEWNGLNPEHGLPNFLRNADYVMTFCDDKLNSQLEMRTKLNRAARVYVLIDNRVELPQWLLDEFEDTQYDVGVDESARAASWQSLGQGAGVSVDKTFSVWYRDVPQAATILTGPLMTPTNISLMYCLAVVPLEVAEQIVPDPMDYHQPRIGSGHIRPELLPTPLVEPLRERVANLESLTIAQPSATDLTANYGVFFKLQSLNGRLMPHKLVRVERGFLPTLNDGLHARNFDDLERNVWFDGQGRFSVDLLQPAMIVAINTFSCHRFERAPQFFTLWGSNAERTPEANFETAKEAKGWEYIGMSHTHHLGDGAVHVSSFQGKEAPLGPYRHLLWIAEDLVNGTFFTEIDVLHAK